MKRRTKTMIEFYEVRNQTIIHNRSVLTKLGTTHRMECWKIISFGGKHSMYLFFTVDDGVPNTLDVAQIETTLKPLIESCAIVSAVPIPSSEGRLEISFNLLKNKGFCESALEILYGVLIAFSVHKLDAKDFLRSFRISQEQEVKWDGQWMGYGQYLKLTLPLLSFN